MGIPVGIFVDNKGPRPAVLAGALLLGVGYFPLRQAYVSGEGSLAALCFYAVCTGFGSCSAFAAAVKVSALNWPHHRGTATAFPLAAFGLSAFFFSAFAQLAFEGNTGDFLLLLAAGTSGIIFVSFFFMHIYPHSAYSSIPTSDTPSSTDSNPLIRTRSQETKHANRRASMEPGTLYFPLPHFYIKHILIGNHFRVRCRRTGHRPDRDQRDVLVAIIECLDS